MPTLLISILLFIISPVIASADSITFYRDGAIIERGMSGIKGSVELPLRPGFVKGTLQVSPASGTSILTVEINSLPASDYAKKELGTLLEAIKQQEDRLQALNAREKIFTAAAKSQSAKTPRKSKSNPDPMKGIRQGTDFAIARLEAVYDAKRKAELEIKRLDARIAAIRKQAGAQKNIARIKITPARGRVTVRYATTEVGWQPRYDLHLAKNGSTELQLFAHLTGTLFSGGHIKVSDAYLADSATAPLFLITPGSRTLLSTYKLPIDEEQLDSGIYNRFSCRITNGTTGYLQPGDTTLYKNGVYRGNFRFEGLSSGRSRVIRVGK